MTREAAHLGRGAIIVGRGDAAVSLKRTKAGEGTLIGAGATVTPGINIGSWALVGAGAVIIEDVPDYAVVVGNPGRIIKYAAATNHSGH